MNGIEVESIIFSHQFARHTDNPEIKRALAISRRVEQQQQKAVNGLNPGDQTPLETTIGYEQVAVDLTAWLARTRARPDAASRRSTSRCSRTSTTSTATPTSTSCSTAARPTSSPST